MVQSQFYGSVCFITVSEHHHVAHPFLLNLIGCIGMGDSFLVSTSIHPLTLDRLPAPPLNYLYNQVLFYDHFSSDLLELDSNISINRDFTTGMFSLFVGSVHFPHRIKTIFVPHCQVYKLLFSFHSDLCGDFLALRTLILTFLICRSQVKVSDILKRRWRRRGGGIGDICTLWPRTLLPGAVHENVSKSDKKNPSRQFIVNFHQTNLFPSIAKPS